jgi:hypothetical protein
MNKPVALVLSALFLVGPAGLAAAQEKQETTPVKAVGKSKNANGTVKATTSESLTVVGKDQKEWTFAVDTKTSIKKAGKSVVVTDLKEGEPVHVRFTVTDGTLHATAITVKAGGTAKKETKY